MPREPVSQEPALQRPSMAEFPDSRWLQEVRNPSDRVPQHKHGNGIPSSTDMKGISSQPPIAFDSDQATTSLYANSRSSQIAQYIVGPDPDIESNYIPQKSVPGGLLSKREHRMDMKKPAPSRKKMPLFSIVLGSVLLLSLTAWVATIEMLKRGHKDLFYP